MLDYGYFRDVQQSPSLGHASSPNESSFFEFFGFLLLLPFAFLVAASSSLSSSALPIAFRLLEFDFAAGPPDENDNDCVFALFVSLGIAAGCFSPGGAEDSSSSGSRGSPFATLNIV